MKAKFLTLVSLFVISTGSILALDNYPFSVGVGVAGKLGINVSDVPSGFQNAISFLEGVDAAAMVYFPMSDESRTGVFIELGYTNAPFGLKVYNGQEHSYYNQKWLTVSPLLLMSGFSVGFDFGFNAFDDYCDAVRLFGNLPINKESFNVSIRLGYMQPILSTHIGVLNFTVNGTYNITGATYSGDYTYNPTTISVGLNYLFNLAIGEDF